MIFEAPTLEEAYKKAAEYFGCSVTEFTDTKLVQAPSNLLFGFIKKNAIVEINYQKTKEEIKEVEDNKNNEEDKKELKPIKNSFEESKKIEDKKEVIEEDNKELQDEIEEEKDIIIEETEEEKKIKELESKIKEKKEQPSKITKKEIKIDNFVEDEELSFDEKIDKIREEVNNLFKLSCYKLNPIKVTKWDEETVLIVFDGEDAALLIGKEGYRYNALSYMLFNWVNQKYNLRIRLEVAEFLKNQEEMMQKLLVPIIEVIEKEGRVTTKPFDGILLHIAVDILRNRFPDKYVGVKINRENQKYIVVNQFLKKDEF